MPRVPNAHAISTKASIASLFAMAETHGEVEIILPSKHAMILVRQKCYAHRSQLRKSAKAHVGIEASSLDGCKFSFWPETKDVSDIRPPGFADDVETGRWFFKITWDEIVEFEIIIPDWYDLEEHPLPHFDVNFDEAPEPDFAPEPPPPEDDIPF